MARFAGLGLEPILADSDDDEGDIGFRRSGYGRTGADDGRKRGSGGGNDPMTDTWQNEVGNIKVNDRGMRVAQRDGQEELLLEGQVVPDQLVFGDGRVIGRGACSVVNLAKHKDTGQLFAVKVFSLLDREKRRQLDREIGTLLRSLENGCCSQLVDFFGAFKRPDGSIRVVLEYMDRGSLADVMDYRCAIQARWMERRDLQVKQEQEAKQKRKEAAEAAAIAAAKAAAKAAARAAAKVVAKVSSMTTAVNGHASAARYERARGDASKGRAVPAPGVEEEDDDDDMPATLERLGAHPTPSQPAPHQQQQQQKHQQKHHPNGVGRRDARDGYSSRNRGTATSNKSGSSSGIRRNNNNRNFGNNIKEEGTSAAAGKGRGEAGWVLEEAYHSAPPQGTDLGLLPAGSRSVVKPPPLSAGACSTPAEAFLERGRGRVDAPWMSFVDNMGDGGSSDSGALRESSEDDGDEDFEAAERRRVDAAAELQRQKEQEEWDRAFEEELVQSGLPEDVVAACAYQILAGLTYLHEHNQLHRDVKPSNILLNARGEVKLTDFGIARELDHAGAMVDTVVGTVRYMSPERLHGEAYGRPADVWGLGLVMIECVTQRRKPPYADGCSQIEILQTLKEHGGSGLLPTGAENRAPLSKAFVGFIANCLQVKPEERLTTSQLLDSDWFVEQGVHGREEAVELMSEYLEGLYGPHAFKYFGDEGDLQPPPMA